jgi:hypothetical protein
LVRNRKRTTDRASTSPDVIAKAVKAVSEKELISCKLKVISILCAMPSLKNHFIGL